MASKTRVTFHGGPLDGHVAYFSAVPPSFPYAPGGGTPVYHLRKGNEYHVDDPPVAVIAELEAVSDGE